MLTIRFSNNLVRKLINFSYIFGDLKNIVCSKVYFVNLKAHTYAFLLTVTNTLPFKNLYSLLKSSCLSTFYSTLKCLNHNLFQFPFCFYSQKWGVAVVCVHPSIHPGRGCVCVCVCLCMCPGRGLFKMGNKNLTFNETFAPSSETPTLMSRYKNRYYKSELWQGEIRIFLIIFLSSLSHP